MADQTVWYRGEGGVAWEFTLPLTESAQEQVRKHQLVECDPPDDAQSGGTALPVEGQPVAVTKPAQHDPKSAWVDYAVAHGMSRLDADNRTKAELIDQFSDT